jgi:predicted SAM-dependent methyltransferase
MAVRLVVGAKATEYRGWVSTDLRDAAATPLDIRDVAQWSRYFRPGTVETIVCDHVLEHMSMSEARQALANFRTYLKPGGFARIAVPDALNPNPYYQQMCCPNGQGEQIRKLFWYAPDEPGHIEHYDYKSLSSLIYSVGLTPQLHEWFDEHGTFQRAPWDVRAAPIKRYLGSPYNERFTYWLGYPNLSLVVDAHKI